MMKPFATSERWNMTPLGFKGLLVSDCHEQIRAGLIANADFLARHGMPDAQLFLAEPEHGASGLTDWYCDRPGRPVPLTRLSTGEQAAVRRKLVLYARAIKALIAKQKDQDGMAANMFRLAMLHPSHSDIYVSGGEPVLINWGWGPGHGSCAEPENILRLAEHEPPGPEPVKKAAAVTAPPDDTGSAPAASCAGAGSASAFASVPASGAAVQNASGEAPRGTGCWLMFGKLALLVALVLLLLMVARCLRERHEQGALLEIPRDAVETGRLDFLDGCWVCNHGLRSKRTDEPVVVEYCFRSDGTGTRTIQEQRGTVFKGPVQASIRDRGLSINADVATYFSGPSGQGAGYAGQSVICTGHGRETVCKGVEHVDAGPQTNWDARFTRR